MEFQQPEIVGSLSDDDRHHNDEEFVQRCDSELSDNEGQIQEQTTMDNYFPLIHSTQCHGSQPSAGRCDQKRDAIVKKQATLDQLFTILCGKKTPPAVTDKLLGEGHANSTLSDHVEEPAENMPSDLIRHR